MDRSAQRAPKRKRWCRLQKEAPFPIPIATITNEPASARNWYYYEGELVGTSVFIKHSGDMKLIYNMGFFGKGTTSRWGIRSLQSRARQDRDTLQVMKKHRYLRHCRWRKQADFQAGKMPAEEYIDTDMEEQMTRSLDQNRIAEDGMKKMKGEENVNSAASEDQEKSIFSKGNRHSKQWGQNSALGMYNDESEWGQGQSKSNIDSNSSDYKSEKEMELAQGEGHPMDWNNISEKESEDFWATPEVKSEYSSWDAVDEKDAEEFWGTSDTEDIQDKKTELGQGQSRSPWGKGGTDTGTMSWDVSGTVQNNNVLGGVGEIGQNKSNTVVPSNKTYALSQGQDHSDVSDNNDSRTSAEFWANVADGVSNTDGSHENNKTDLSEKSTINDKSTDTSTSKSRSDHMPQDGNALEFSTGTTHGLKSQKDSQLSKLNSDIVSDENEKSQQAFKQSDNGENCEDDNIVDERSLMNDPGGELYVVESSEEEEEDVTMATRLKWRPCQKREEYKVKEYLCLSLEEAFFLSYGLGCLVVHDESKKKLNLTEMWRKFCSRQKNFLNNYIAYHSLRSKGWVPKTGIKYGAEFILYKQGPPFYHSSYSVVVLPVKEENLEQEKLLSWTSLAGMNRVTEQVSKEVLLCYVIRPRGVTDEDLSSPACVPKFKIMEVIIERWVAPQERDNQGEQQFP
ncbi:tRNA-splicing endonuclease subunit Sen2 [Lingula anatina]|uniref:tRNA-intron lyase n=1 Tax=Lingula anatina TaxID=7574 RepID=A0A1S3K7C4_LINAN|nr:tRNA-splicing endonuclease subunit Sen2 [Lingula anatina]|eukprot:XP_013418344.1 tRNA-splicing endonuclease subunit Sen2 [Lingula anatina]